MIYLRNNYNQNIDLANEIDIYINSIHKNYNLIIII